MKIARPKSTQPVPENAREVFKGKIFSVYQWEQEMFDGSIRIFEKAKRPDTVIIFPVLDDGRILLIEDEQPGRSVHICAIGGRTDEAEDPVVAVKRELLEETGYEASEVVLWKADQQTVKIDWVVYAFIAKGLKKVAEQELDGGEKITFKPVTLDELFQLVREERFADKEVMHDLLLAQIDSEKRKELENLFSL